MAKKSQIDRAVDTFQQEKAALQQQIALLDQVIARLKAQQQRITPRAKKASAPKPPKRDPRVAQDGLRPSPEVSHGLP